MVWRERERGVRGGVEGERGEGWCGGRERGG